jgi:hypothetical protein
MPPEAAFPLRLRIARVYWPTKASKAIEHITIPAIAMPRPLGCRETETTPSTRPAIENINPPAIVSLSQGESSNRAKIQIMPSTNDGIGNQ